MRDRELYARILGIEVPWRVEVPERLGMDETSFQKRHEYVMVVNDLEGRVLHCRTGTARRRCGSSTSSSSGKSWRG